VLNIFRERADEQPREDEKRPNSFIVEETGQLL